jgi:hypothetical protein
MVNHIRSLFPLAIVSGVCFRQARLTEKQISGEVRSSLRTVSALKKHGFVTSLALYSPDSK